MSAVDIFTHPITLETVKTMSTHCPSCGSNIRFIIPSDQVYLKEEIDFYKKLAKSREEELEKLNATALKLMLH